MDESLIAQRRSSSPFVSEIASRSPSKQYDDKAHLDYSLHDTRDDKENAPLNLKSSISKDNEMMPPPARTPRRSPLKARQDGDSSGLISRRDIDDTCFSTFSEVPTARLSPIKTPGTSRKRQSSRSPSPTPRRLKSPTQTYLIDFTQQIEDLGQAGRLPTSKTEPNLLQHLNRQRSPAKARPSLATPKILNLLDFELPPAPTPRSIPTITVRELETLKSQYLSQISSLKATLNGREAEVESLKRAIGDAERRVGDAQQALKEEKNSRELAEQERLDWERRGVEVENLLKSVREEVLASEVEKEELLQKVEDYERRLEEARTVQTGDASVDEQVQQLVAAQIDAKIEAVSRELHAVYKDKHERKVATLKKSYEARSEKRTAELQAKVEEMQKTSKAQQSSSPSLDTASKVELEEHRAHAARLEEELNTSKAQRDELVRALEQERIEKGDLVAAVDEMLALQADAPGMAVVEDFRKSISRPPSSAGLRRPSESRIAKIPTLRTPAANKSRMLANIERMGRSAIADGA